MPEPFVLEAKPGVPAYVTRRTGEILAAERVASLLPECRTVRACVERVVAADLSLALAHETWLPGYLVELRGLSPLQQQPATAVTPPGVARVVIECVDEPSGGMSSFYGFRGTFVSLLVSLPQGCVWDARVEPAT
jgi:hypothetical protein